MEGREGVDEEARREGSRNRRGVTVTVGVNEAAVASSVAVESPSADTSPPRLCKKEPPPKKQGRQQGSSGRQQRRRPRVLCLGVSYPCLDSTRVRSGRTTESSSSLQQPLGEDCREDNRKQEEGEEGEEEITVEDAIESVRQGVLTQMDGRDLARCRATELHCHVDVYTVSREQGAVYRSDRHLEANFNRPEALCKAIQQRFILPQQQQQQQDGFFDQILLDYFWCPAEWNVAHWHASFFERTLPLWIHQGILRTTKGCKVYLPFCLHCFQQVLAAYNILRNCYNISFLRQGHLDQIALWKGTQQIDRQIMQGILGKRLDQEEIYCTFGPQQLAGTMEHARVSKDALFTLARSLEDFGKIRFLVLEPLSSSQKRRQHPRPSPPLSSPLTTTTTTTTKTSSRQQPFRQRRSKTTAATTTRAKPVVQQLGCFLGCVDPKKVRRGFDQHFVSITPSAPPQQQQQQQQQRIQENPPTTSALTGKRKRSTSRKKTPSTTTQGRHSNQRRAVTPPTTFINPDMHNNHNLYDEEEEEEDVSGKDRSMKRRYPRRRWRQLRQEGDDADDDHHQAEEEDEEEEESDFENNTDDPAWTPQPEQRKAPPTFTPLFRARKRPKIQPPSPQAQQQPTAATTKETGTNTAFPTCGDPTLTTTPTNDDARVVLQPDENNQAAGGSKDCHEAAATSTSSSLFLHPCTGGQAQLLPPEGKNPQNNHKQIQTTPFIVTFDADADADADAATNPIREQGQASAQVENIAAKTATETTTTTTTTRPEATANAMAVAPKINPKQRLQPSRTCKQQTSASSPQTESPRQKRPKQRKKKARSIATTKKKTTTRRR